MSGASPDDISRILRILGMPRRTRLEVDRCADSRRFEVALVLGIHGVRSWLDESVVEDTQDPAALACRLLETMRDLLLPAVVTAAARAWADLHRPEGLPC
jgi:hypothetical protein